MGLIESISRGALGLRADVGGTPAPWDDYWYNPLGSASASGMRITEASAKRVATVLACVGVIGRNVGTMPCRIYTEAPDGSKKLVNHHPLYDVLYSRPNDQQTAFEFKQMMQGHLELRGNAYAEIKPGPRGAVDQLLPMMPDRVHVERLKPSGRLRYVYNDPLTGTTRNLAQEEVFHLRNFSDDGAVGQSTIGMACDTFGIALAQQDNFARFIKNDSRPPFVFEGTHFKNTEDEKKFRENWQRGQTGSERGKAGILPLGVTIKELGVKPVDQQLLDARKFSRIEICSIFGVPPHLIGETEKTATYASVEQFNIMYAVHCILPRLVLWEQAISRDLITSGKYFARFDMAALLRGDTASRYEAYHVAIGDGWMCQDEVRAFENMNPIPDGIGRNFWRPLNYTLLSNTSAPALPTPPPADSAPVDPSNGPGDDSATTTGDDSGATAERQGSGVSNLGSGKNADTRYPTSGALSAHVEGPGCECPGCAVIHAQKVRLQLEVLAASVADRCVRKEIAGLRKMIERGGNDYDVEEFYRGQTEFIGQAFNLDGGRMVAIHQSAYDRASEVTRLLAAGDKAAAFDYIDRLAVMEAHRLATQVIAQ
jgi:HK97 family phage portal protein